jgi:neutral ceramidase
MLGTSDIKNLVVPGALDASIKTFKQLHRKGALSSKAWTAQVLPLQAAIIGQVLFAAFPFEITTMAARQLKESLFGMLTDKGIEEIILCPYANSYQGYITTRAEYNFQSYEGGHTVFGEWSLAALQTCFADLIAQLYKPEDQREQGTVVPIIFEEDELMKRSYYKRNYIIKAEKKAEKAASLKK